MSKNKQFRLPGIFKMLVALCLFSSVAFGQSAAVRIMPLGDSITGSPGCWRALLWDHLQKTGITNIDFVGTQPPQGCSVPYDGDSEGHGGALATSVADQNQLPVWLAATHPDIVMMHFGTNDIWSGRTTAVILTAFSKLVDQMRASNPNMILLVAQIIPVNPSTCPDCAQRTIEFNAAIPAWAAGKSTADSPIIVVDQWTGFNSATDTVEGVHPNGFGDQKIADKWFPVLSALLLGQPPAPGFSLSASPPFPQIAAGGTGTVTISVSRSGGFTGPINLIPPPIAGWSISFSANPITGNSSVMTIGVPSGATEGLHNVPIVGTAAGVTHSVSVDVSVPQQLTPFFTIFGSLGNQTVELGTSSTNTITINRINNFSGPVALSTGPLPAGITARFNPNPATGLSSILTFTASPTAAVATSQILVIGTGTPGSLNTSINLRVADPASTPCGTATPIPLPFARDGAGEFCFSTAGTITFVNSWNMQLVEINGVPFTNIWSNALPPRINGNYYIHYVATLSSAHFEANGTSASTNLLLNTPASFSFFPGGGNGAVSITSNVSWTATADQPWLTVAPASGANNGTITITAPPNPSPMVRVGAVTLSGGGLTRTIGISQGGATTTNTLAISPTSISFVSAPATGTVTITSNINWTATADQPWLTVTPASGANNGALTVSAPANPGPASRLGNVTVSGGGLTRTVGVTQSGPIVTTLCASPIAITLPVARNGVGDFCWVTSGNIAFVNSWNMQLLEINGVAFTNRWANSLPPRINGNYYFHYVANVAFAHFEANGTP